MFLFGGQMTDVDEGANPLWFNDLHVFQIFDKGVY